MLFSILVAAIFVFTACSATIPGVVKKEIKMGKIDFEVIDIKSKEFSELNKKDFKTWYEDNYKNGGVYSFSKDGERYILIGAGERLTSGYTMKDIVLYGKEGEIEVRARLYGPREGESTTHVVNYPHVLLKIKDDGRKLSCQGVELKVNSAKREQKKESGIFKEITKDGLLKVELAGESNDAAIKEYRLDDKAMESIGKINLESGMEIIITYYLDDDENPIVVEVNKI